MAQKIAYIMSRFPHLPETFILREMIAIEELGLHISLYPLMLQKQTIIHAEAQDWMTRCNQLGWISPEILSANWHQLRHNPARYASLFLRLFSGHLRNPKIFIRALAMFPKAARMAELMKAEGIQHIHAHYATYPALAAWLIHNLTGIPYSITVHAHDIYVDRTMLAPKIRDATFIAAISQFNRQFLAHHLGEWVLPKIHVVHCGIQPERYQPAQKTDSNCFELVSIGSLQPYKGQHDLIAACAHLRQRGLNFRCQIIGGGELLADLQNQINETQLNDFVVLTGPQPQDKVAEILSQADCYVQPSIITPSGKMEGIPVALMEALAVGLPVIATDISGISELVQPGRTGWLTPEKDPLALANAILEVKNQPAEAQKRAQAGKMLVYEEFDLRKNSALLVSLFSPTDSAWCGGDTP
jgi:colanic acid/amylovoran biosynthesis glycosyltransferase